MRMRSPIDPLTGEFKYKTMNIKILWENRIGSSVWTEMEPHVHYRPLIDESTLEDNPLIV